MPLIVPTILTSSLTTIMTFDRNSMYRAESMYGMFAEQTMHSRRSMYAAQALSAYAEQTPLQLSSGVPEELSGVPAERQPSTQYAAACMDSMYATKRVSRLIPSQLVGEGERPLKVAHINAAMIPAGIEYWLAALCHYANPSRLQFLRTVVLTDWVDQRQVARIGMPVEVGGRDSVVAAATECDVLLVSDPGQDSRKVASWINEARPALTVFVAHGDGYYTADRMAGIGSAVDHIVAVSEHVRRVVCDGRPVSVILNGVDPKRLVRTQPRRQCRDQLGFSPSDFVVGFVGRFSQEKRPDLVINAVARLPQHVKLLLVGHGYLRDQLIAHCLKELPGRFSLVEGDGNLGNLYAAMDTLVMPSQMEGYGLVAMEAMLSGVPLIATPFGMVVDLVTDGADGLVVSLTPDSIACAISKLDKSPELRQCLVAGGHRLAEQSGYAVTMARQYESLLWQLWDQHNPNRQGRS